MSSRVAEYLRKNQLNKLADLIFDRWGLQVSSQQISAIQQIASRRNVGGTATEPWNDSTWMIWLKKRLFELPAEVQTVSESACHEEFERLDKLRPFMFEDSQEFPQYPNQHAPDGFPLGCISKRTVVYSCGVIAIADSDVEHKHPAGELDLCRRLSEAACQTMAGVELSYAYFTPFFVTAKVGTRFPEQLSESFVRICFGGVIWKNCRIWIEPLAEKGEWWEGLAYHCEDDEEKEYLLRPWRSMISWFHSQRDLQHSSYVSIGNDFQDGGTVFPRLVVGITKLGSLVGMISEMACV